MADIVIEKLKVSAIVGIMDWERCVEQELLVDLKLTCDIEKAALSKNIDDAIDYSAVCEVLEAFIQEKKFLLLETLLEECSNYLLDRFSIEKIFMRCMKTQVLPNTSGVGIEIEKRSRANI
ncbi:MAG: dihydroneopterin aldolase [Agarilytica sp.]